MAPTDGDGNVLRKAIAHQEERLRAAQKAHGEFHLQVSDDLAQLALLYNMNGEHDKALPLLHQRLVIHEKYGPDELTGETLQELGTAYRLHSMPEIASQHLQRALELRERCHGKNSLKVAETLNSLALVSQMQSELPQAEAFQLRSLQVLYESAEPEDIESEDVPWEVYKRLKQQRGPSTAANSVTLLKGSMRKSVMDVVYKSPRAPGAVNAKDMSGDRAGAAPGTGSYVSGTRAGAGLHERVGTDLDRKRTLRSQSDSTMDATIRDLLDGESPSDRLAVFHTEGAKPSFAEAQASGNDFSGETRNSLGIRATSLTIRTRPETADNVAAFAPAYGGGHSRLPPMSPLTVPSQAIRDFPTLQQRVESLKRRIVAGYPDVNADVARLAADVDLIQARELRDVGATLVSLVREMNRLCVRSDSSRQQLPVLEGMLEKKSASIFRGWEKRWFKVDPKTFILSYHFSADDHARGFTPRGGFAVSRISNILVQRHARGSHFHFDVVVDLSTRLNPHGSRTYELRCENEEALRYWVETLHFYKAMAQKTPPRPSTG